MEKTMIIGNIGKDASVNEVNGRKAINFNVAVNESWKDDKGQKQTRTTWFSCTRWLNVGENDGISKFLLSGTQVFIEGNLRPTLYKTKDNQTAIDMKLNVKSIQLLGSKEKTEGQPATATAGTDEEFPT
jgi:single-strand DNA-binding protein